MVRQYAIAAWPVGHLGLQTLHPASGMMCRAVDRKRSRRAMSWSGDRVGPVFSFSPRNFTTWPISVQRRIRPRVTESAPSVPLVTQLCQAVGVFKHIDGLELDRTDREKLFEFQAAGSSRLPQYLQRDIAGHDLTCILAGNKRGETPGRVNAAASLRNQSKWLIWINLSTRSFAYSVSIEFHSAGGVIRSPSIPPRPPASAVSG